MSNNDNKDEKVDTVGLFLRAMVDREPGKRKVKASKTALIDLAQLEMGDSSDDSDFNVDEAKLNEDDDISINSDPEADDKSSSGEEEEDDEEDDDSDESEDDVTAANNHVPTISELLQRAQEKQEQLNGAPQILVCAVCLGDNSDDTNEIVTCDGWCRVSVHEGCYGVSDTISVSSTVSSCSTEPWFCDACKAGVRNPPCELCPNLGYSIFKETEMGRFVHLVCALYGPGVAFSEVDKLSCPTLFEMAYSRWGSKICSLCEDSRYAKTGICIGCDAGMCRSYFHVTCAQREGLLSEVNQGEADHADPYYAHCKLHTEKETIKRRKRNWLTLQLNTKLSEKLTVSPKEQKRLERKLARYQDKSVNHKATRPLSWFPTQKMPRPISTNANVFRQLLHKTKLMGLNTETPQDEVPTIGDIRKKWHVPPAFSVEFTSYYLDRWQRIKEMKDKLHALQTANSSLTQDEAAMKKMLETSELELKTAREEHTILLNKSLELHNLMKGLAGRPLPLPPVVAAIHNPPSAVPEPLATQNKPGPGAGRETRRLITKAAAKMLADLPPTGASLGHSRDATTPGSAIAPSTGSLSRTPVNFVGTKVRETSQSVSSPARKDGCDDASPVRSGTISTPTTPAKKKQLSLGNTSNEVHTCSVCKLDTDQQLLIQCDTCVLYYHLCCLDPPLTRMPKKTKQMGWQCSDCGKSSDSEKITEIDMSAPRRLRRMIKEPAKFSPSVGAATSTDSSVLERSPLSQLASESSLSSQTTIETSGESAVKLTKRRRSNDLNKSGAGVRKNKKVNSEMPSSGRGKRKPDNNLPFESLHHRKVSHKLKESLKEDSVSKNNCFKVDETSMHLSAQICVGDVKIDNNLISIEATSVSTANRSSEPITQYSTTMTPVSTSQSSTPATLQEMQAPDGLEKNSVCGRITSTYSNEYTTTLTSVPGPPLNSVGGANTAFGQAVPVSFSVHPLDVSAESLPSAASLYSPTSESLPSHEEDNHQPLSPRKEKRHRDGSKKKKKDKDRDKSSDRAEKKRRKHHHVYWDSQLPQSSEMLGPLRLKIKPLPPRPPEVQDVFLPSIKGSVSITCLSQPVPCSSGNNESSSNATPTLDATDTLYNVTLPPTAALPSSPISAALVNNCAVTVTPVAGPASKMPSLGEVSGSEKNASVRTMIPSEGPAGISPATLSYSPVQSDEGGGATSQSNASARRSSSSTVTGAVSVTATGRRRSESTSTSALPVQQFSKCDVCGETGGVTNTVACDECHKAYHFNCLDPPLKKTPKRRGYSWFCEDCEPSK